MSKPKLSQEFLELKIKEWSLLLGDMEESEQGENREKPWERNRKFAVSDVTLSPCSLSSISPSNSDHSFIFSSKNSCDSFGLLHSTSHCSPYNASDVIGVYPLLKNNTCRFLVFDFDNHEKNAEENDFAIILFPCSGS